jgi:hypothetical protein
MFNLSATGILILFTKKIQKKMFLDDIYSVIYDGEIQRMVNSGFFVTNLFFHQNFYLS